MQDLLTLGKTLCPDKILAVGLRLPPVFSGFAKMMSGSASIFKSFSVICVGGENTLPSLITPSN